MSKSNRRRNSSEPSIAQDNVGATTVVNVAAPPPASTDAPREKRIESWLVADLKPHPDRLDRARLAKRLMQIERAGGRWTLSDGDREELRDRVGKQLGLSGRHAERLIKILSTPMAVQRAYSRQQITLVDAVKVAGLG